MLGMEDLSLRSPCIRVESPDGEEWSAMLSKAGWGGKAATKFLAGVTYLVGKESLSSLADTGDSK